MRNIINRLIAVGVISSSIFLIGCGNGNDNNKTEATANQSNGALSTIDSIIAEADPSIADDISSFDSDFLAERKPATQANAELIDFAGITFEPAVEPDSPTSSEGANDCDASDDILLITMYTDKRITCLSRENRTINLVYYNHNHGQRDHWDMNMPIMLRVSNPETINVHSSTTCRFNQGQSLTSADFNRPVTLDLTKVASVCDIRLGNVHYTFHITYGLQNEEDITAFEAISDGRKFVWVGEETGESSCDGPNDILLITMYTDKKITCLTQGSWSADLVYYNHGHKDSWDLNVPIVLQVSNPETIIADERTSCTFNQGQSPIEFNTPTTLDLTHHSHCEIRLDNLPTRFYAINITFGIQNGKDVLALEALGKRNHVLQPDEDACDFSPYDITVITTNTDQEKACLSQASPTVNLVYYNHENKDRWDLNMPIILQSSNPEAVSVSEETNCMFKGGYGPVEFNTPTTLDLTHVTYQCKIVLSGSEQRTYNINVKFGIRTDKDLLALDALGMKGRRFVLSYENEEKQTCDGERRVNLVTLSTDKREVCLSPGSTANLVYYTKTINTYGGDTFTYWDATSMFTVLQAKDHNPVKINTNCNLPGASFTDFHQKINIDLYTSQQCTIYVINETSSGIYHDQYTINVTFGIKAAEDLFAMNRLGRNKGRSFSLENDIDLASYADHEGSFVKEFQGFFDGKEHSIKNLSIKKLSTQNNDCFAGLFGRIYAQDQQRYSPANPATVKNLTIILDKLETAGSCTRTGGLAGETTVSTEDKRNPNIAPILIKNVNVISEWSEQASIKCDSFCGGLIGNAIFTDIYDTTVELNVKLECKNLCAGMVGYAKHTHIINNHSRMFVDVSCANACGTVVGAFDDGSAANIDTFLRTEHVSATNYLGGFAGTVEGSTINKISYYVALSNDPRRERSEKTRYVRYAGGVAGSVDESSITEAKGVFYFVEMPDQVLNIGGIVGVISRSSIDKSYARTLMRTKTRYESENSQYDVSSDAKNLGGIAGHAVNSSLKESTVIGEFFIGSRKSQNFGAIAGKVNAGVIRDIVALSTMTKEDPDNEDISGMGGAIGLVQYNDNNAYNGGRIHIDRVAVAVSRKSTDFNVSSFIGMVDIPKDVGSFHEPVLSVSDSYAQSHNTMGFHNPTEYAVQFLNETQGAQFYNFFTAEGKVTNDKIASDSANKNMFFNVYAAERASTTIPAIKPLSELDKFDNHSQLWQPNPYQSYPMLKAPEALKNIFPLNNTSMAYIWEEWQKNR